MATSRTGLRGSPASGIGGAAEEALLTPGERAAADAFIGRVRREIPARLVQASLFGSKARRQARPDSDLDILLVFHRLSWDREPQASHAEALAEQVAADSGVPVTCWSVSFIDLERGHRTPMLVDALEDSVPLWWERAPLRPVAFTPDDALHCVDALLARVAEGSEEFRSHLASGADRAALRRVRDDLVRLCTAGLLLRGITRPRRGEAVLRFLEWVRIGDPPPRESGRVLLWAAVSFGPDGTRDEADPPPPPGGPAAAGRTVGLLRRRVVISARRLAAGAAAPGT